MRNRTALAVRYSRLRRCCPSSPSVLTRDLTFAIRPFAPEESADRRNARRGAPIADALLHQPVPDFPAEYRGILAFVLLYPALHFRGGHPRFRTAYHAGPYRARLLKTKQKVALYFCVGFEPRGGVFFPPPPSLTSAAARVCMCVRRRFAVFAPNAP